MPRREPLKQRNDKSMALLKQILADNRDVEDLRLSPGALHQVAVEALGCEPLAFACNIIALSMDARSKITIKPEEAARIALAVCDRVYGPPDAKVKRKSDEQFELDFSWKLPDGEITVKAEGEFG